MEAEKLTQLIIKGIQEKKGVDITIVDLRKIKHAITDFFVICSGNSDTQIEAIAESVESEVYKKERENPWHLEGKQNKEWVLLDYIDVVVHIFNKEKRGFFDLENMWGDAVITNVNS